MLAVFAVSEQLRAGISGWRAAGMDLWLPASVGKRNGKKAGRRSSGTVES